MKAHEHRSIGDQATAGAQVNLGGEAPNERFLLGYGDVMALSGDFFAAECPLPRSAEPGGASAGAPDGTVSGAEGGDPDGLFTIARIPGDRGTLAGTRDEVICALRVMAVDEGFSDARFGPRGEFEDYRFSAAASLSEVERRVRDRFLALATENDDHFVSPVADGVGRHRTSSGGSRFGSAQGAYHALHRVALEEAWRLGRSRGDLSRALAREAAAQHYLTDAFASGHLRTPVAAIREFWDRRYPRFWSGLQRRVAADTARAFRVQAAPLRLIPPGLLHRCTLSVLRSRTRKYPQLNLGDLLARVYHDWDNEHGLILEDGTMLYGDGQLDRGAGRQLAVAAVRAGIDDVEAAHRLGRISGQLSSGGLYDEVRRLTGAPPGGFRAELMIPTASPRNPPLTWLAGSVEALWESAIAGAGATVGEVVSGVLEVGGEVSRRLDCLGHGGAVEASRLLALPGLGAWGAAQACRAYHRGFIEPLAADPRSAVLDMVAG